MKNSASYLIFFLAFIVALLFINKAHADDAAFFGDGADVYPLQQGDIQLVSETITITDYRALNPGKQDLPYRWIVHVDMAFKNHGPDTTIQMGFPLYGADEGGGEDDQEIPEERIDVHFKTWIDGKEVAVVKKRGVPGPGLLADLPKSVYAYPVSFKKNELKKIVHSYNVGGYFDSIGGWKFTYVLRTGGLWKDSIESVKINYMTHASQARTIGCITPKEHDSALHGNELTLSWNFVNYKPSSDLVISGNRSSGFDGPIESLMKSHKRGFISADSCGIRQLKNAVYASFGYPFKSPYLRTKFYSPNSAYKENPAFTEKLIPPDHKRYLEYLIKVENWKMELVKKRAHGLLEYEKTQKGRQVSFESMSSLLVVDRQRNTSFMLDHDHLLVMKHPEGVPSRQVQLPSSITSGSELSVALSPNGKYLAISYFYEKAIILIIDTTTPLLLHEIPAGFGEIRSHPQFDRSSSVLYTSDGAYDVASGKKVKQWIYPTDHKISNIHELLTMYSGMLNDGSLLFGCWALNRIYRVDPAAGSYTVFKDFTDSGQAILDGKISPDASMFAAFAQKSKLKGNQYVIVRSDFIIWRLMQNNTLKQIYSEEQTKKNRPSGWTWARQNNIVTAIVDETNRYKLRRYDIVLDSVSSIDIPFDGLTGGQNMISVGDFFISTYGPRLWDVASGIKVAPWYEAFDPFDESNRLSLYDEKPSVVRIRDFWGN